MKPIKTVVIIILLLLTILILKIPNYVELNDLAIIQGIGFSCNTKEKTMYLKEIIPIKGETGIEYQYEYYQGSGKNIKSILKKIEQKTKKKIYLSQTKFIITNCKKTNKILKELKLKDTKIYLHNAIEKKLKKTNS